MSELTSAGKKPLSLYLTIIILPFILFYWLMPFVTDLTLGNDYREFSIQNQMELLFSIKTGSFPLYVPGYALGHTSSALSLGEIFHPLPHIASILPGYWEGKALQWNTFLRLVSLGLCHLGLFVFLRRINLNVLFSFLLSLITVYNMRMLDMFRYGASLETYTGFILLCMSIAWYFIKPTKWLGPLSIIGTTYWLVCSGHPTMMFYGLFGSALFLFVVPFFLTAMMPDRENNYKDVIMLYFKTGVFMALGIMLSSAYILPFYFDFMPMNPMRVDLDYDPYTMETLFGTISNFFMPLFSDIHSAFGGSALFLMAAILPVLRLFKVKIPVAIWVIWGFLLFEFLYMQAGRTPVHRWAWDYLPFVSSLRVAGRICLSTPIFIMLLLAWVINAKPVHFPLKRMVLTFNPYMLLALISLLLILQYALFSAAMQIGLIERMELGVFPPKYVNNIPLWVISMVMLSSVLSLLTLIFYSEFSHIRSILGILLCFITCLQIIGIIKYGTFVADRHEQPSFEEMKSQKKIKPDYLYNPGSGMYSSVILTQLDRSFLEPYAGRIYTEAIPVSDQKESYERMQKGRLPHQVFVETLTPEAAATINESAHDMKNGTVDLVYSSFNRLRFSVNSETPALFGMSYPYTGHWNATVDGKETTVYRANGGAHAVEIPGGRRLIEFRYWSNAAFWGTIISCATFVLIGLYLSFGALDGMPRAISALIVIILGVGGAIIWNHSLYTGENLGTKYSWSYTAPVPEPNLAYGRKTSILPVPADTYHHVSSFYHTHRSRVVDGDKSPGAGYIMELENNTSVIIDLYQSREIKLVRLFESITKTPVNRRHFVISVSQDEKHWEKVASVESQTDDQTPIHIRFDAPITARYIRTLASGEGIISLDEIEVY